MKLILIFLTTVFLFGTQNTAFAIISKNSDAPFVSSSTATKVNTEQKPNFLQRLVAKRIAQKWKLLSLTPDLVTH